VDAAHLAPLIAGAHVDGAAVRDHLERAPLPADVVSAVIEAWRALGAEHAYAVRSSATAEDLPGASFAGQQDTYLNVVGEAALLDRVRACFASLFTDRAIVYREKNGFAHDKVSLSVVVQRQIVPRAAGILFTADPVDGRRTVASIDAGFGLGEALVSGLVNADLYKVDKRTRAVLFEKIGDKALAIRAVAGGGTERVELTSEQRSARVLEAAQLHQLVDVGVRIEQHYGKPQDIEWCFDDAGALFIVQARPITTLYPVPSVDTTDGMHILFSFGHAQVMTDAMPPFARSLWRRVFPFARPPRGDSRIMVDVGSRLYIDPTLALRAPSIGPRMLQMLNFADAHIAAAVKEAMSLPVFADGTKPRGMVRAFVRVLKKILPRAAGALLFVDLPYVLEQVNARLARDARALTDRIESRSNAIDRLRDIDDVLEAAFDETIFIVAPLIIAPNVAAALVKRLSHASPEDLASLARGLEGNVTTEMDLALGDVADIARQSPALVERLSSPTEPMPTLAEARALDANFARAIDAFLARYGMRGGSEIDVTRARFSDDPRSLLQVIKGNLGHIAPGAHRAHHARMKSEGEAAAARIGASVHGPKGALVRRFIRVFRALAPLREHPKLQLIRMLGHARRASLEAGEALVSAGRIDAREDAWFFSLRELMDPPAGDLRSIVDERKAAFTHHKKLVPPRVITSEGEIITAQSARALPAGALGGTAASAGVVEGVAHVVLDPATATLRAGEILVAPFTDPGWTPLFINAAGLVMEVGGMMTHGSVVAREYGIPAVVSVPDATTKILTGQRIRVDGTNGVVEILGPAFAEGEAGAASS
jgi:pyruvate,water dikinase